MGRVSAECVLPFKLIEVVINEDIYHGIFTNRAMVGGLKTLAKEDNDPKYSTCIFCDNISLNNLPVLCI